MIVEFDRSFVRSLAKISNPALFRRIERIIKQVDAAASLTEIPQVKKLSGYRNYHRIKLGDYRIGIELIGKNKIRFILVAHRKDIYRFFP